MEHCKNQAEPYIQTGNKCPQIQSWIAWLEKQGEQKPADKVEPIFNVGDKIQYSKGCGTIMTIEKIENGEYIFANNMGHTTIESGNKWHLVEQNPAEWSIFDYRTWQYIVSDVLTKKDGIGQYLDDGGCKKIAKYMQDEWSKRLSVELPKSQDYGIDGLYAAIDILTKTLGEVGGYQSDDGILAHKCSISAVKGLSKQKPAEWSEEDEYTLGETIQHLEELIRIDKAKHCSVDVQYYQRDIDWLKSLKDRVQPKREWNEEDENRFNNLCWLIDQSDENEPTKNGFKNWLKYRALPQPKQEWSEEDEKHRLNCLSYFNMIEKPLHTMKIIFGLNPSEIIINKNGYSNS